MMKRKQVWSAVLSESKGLAQARGRNEEFLGCEDPVDSGRKNAEKFYNPKIIAQGGVPAAEDCGKSRVNPQTRFYRYRGI